MILQKILVKAAKQFYRWANAMEKTKLYHYAPDSELTYAKGATLVYDLLKLEEVNISRLFVTEYPIKEKLFDEALALAEKRKIPIIREKKNQPPKGVQLEMSIAAEVEKPKDTILPGNHVLLSGPSNERNIGAVMRSALAFGICDMAVILDEDSKKDLCSPTVLRTSMGARLRIRVEIFRSLEDYIGRFPENKRYAFMLRNACRLSDVKKEEPYTLIFGNETLGLPDSYAETCQPVFIEQDNTVDSLNLSNAACIAVYEFKKNT